MVYKASASRTNAQSPKSQDNSSIMFRIFSLLALAAVVVCDYPVPADSELAHVPEYNYEYSVHDPHTHDVKNQHEARHDDVVKGFYALKEADGTLREVHYTADNKNGFNAEVKRTGHATHPKIYASSSETFYGHESEEAGHGHPISTSNSNLKSVNIHHH